MLLNDRVCARLRSRAEFDRQHHIGLLGQGALTVAGDRHGRALDMFPKQPGGFDGLAGSPRPGDRDQQGLAPGVKARLRKEHELGGGQRLGRDTRLLLDQCGPNHPGVVGGPTAGQDDLLEPFLLPERAKLGGARLENRQSLPPNFRLAQNLGVGRSSAGYGPALSHRICR